MELGPMSLMNLILVFQFAIQYYTSPLTIHYLFLSFPIDTLYTEIWKLKSIRPSNNFQEKPLFVRLLLDIPVPYNLVFESCTCHSDEHPTQFWFNKFKTNQAFLVYVIWWNIWSGYRFTRNTSSTWFFLSLQSQPVVCMVWTWYSSSNNSNSSSNNSSNNNKRTCITKWVYKKWRRSVVGVEIQANKKRHQTYCQPSFLSLTFYFL